MALIKVMNCSRNIRLIKTNMNHLTTPYFIGHIGGDDLVIILTNHLYSRICEQIIEKFDLHA